MSGGSPTGNAHPAPTEVYRDLIEWPIDSDFWFRWYERGLVCGKLGAPPLYLWRQHAGQHTRTQGRCSLDNLRRCKAHFLLRSGGPAAGAARVEVWSTGRTLECWVADLEEELANPIARGPSDGGADGGGSGQPHGGTEGAPEFRPEIRSVEWKPGAPMTASWRAEHPSKGGPRVTIDGRPVLRLFAFGMPKAREKAKAAVRDWKEGLDWFVA